MSVDVALQSSTDGRKLSRKLRRAGWGSLVAIVLLTLDGQLRSTLGASSSGWARVVAQDLGFASFALTGYALLGLRRYLISQGDTRPRLILGILGSLLLVGALAMVAVFLRALLGSFPDLAPATGQDDGIAYWLLYIFYVSGYVVVGALILIGPVRMFGLKHALGVAFISGAILQSVPYLSTVMSAAIFVMIGIILLRAADEVKG
jgi:hypothetical protein